MRDHRFLASIGCILFACAPPALADTSPGAIVRLYDIGRGVRGVPELAPDQLPNEILTIDTIDLRPGKFGGLTDNFYTEIDALLTIETGGEYVFRLMSDDGSKLWIDDKLLIDNDGLHGADPKDQMIKLTVGVHRLKLRHFEAGGGEQLTLQMRRPTEGEFGLIPPPLLSLDSGISHKTAPGTKRIIAPLRRGRPGDGTRVSGAHPHFRFASIATAPEENVAEAMYPVFTEETPADVINKVVPGAGAMFAWLPSQTDYAPAAMPAPLLAPIDVPPYDGQLLVSPGSRSIFRGSADGAAGRQLVLFRFAETPTGAWIGTLEQSRSLVATACGAQEYLLLQNTEIVPFEMLAARAMTNGFEIEFTKPLDPRVGWEADSYYIEQWPFDTEAGKSPRRDGVRYPVKSASVSADRKRVFLEIENLKPSHVVYLRLLPPCLSEDGELPWSTEAWYTLNAIPEDRMGKVLPRSEREPQNFLTDAEKAEGWRLLFDGATTDGWRGYRKDSMPDGWQVVDDCLVRVGPAGDIVTIDQFANFELKLDWRISAGGNSGIFYHVSENKGAVYETGPEMQVLDNYEHADGGNTLTSTGADYALHAPSRDVTQPIGLFNQVHLVVNGPHVEHWLNGEKIVEFDLWTDDWRELVKNSKFNAWPGFGLNKKGYIALQDHGDQVWFRNIKIRELPAAE
jgi:hypothetical protein